MLKLAKIFVAITLVFISTSCSWIFDLPNVTEVFDAGDAKRFISVVTRNPQGSQAAMEILRQGGTAADAFAAAVAMMTNTEPYAAGIGGGFFALYYDASQKKVFSIDAREEAPRGIDPDVFLDKKSKEPLRFFPDRQSTANAVGVPGVIDGLDLMLKNFGKLSLEEIFKPAIEVAEEGFVVNKVTADYLLAKSQTACDLIGMPRMALFPASRSLFYKNLNTDEHPSLKCNSAEYYKWQPIEEGETLRNPDYARALTILARDGLRSFYEGEIAKTIVDMLTDKRPGYADHKPAFELKPADVDMRDFKNYRAVFREPIKSEYRNSHGQLFEVYGMGPPASGGVAIAQMLNILDNPRSQNREFDISELGPVKAGDKLSYRNAFLLSEIGKIAFNDRNSYLADEDFVSDLGELKKALISTEYADAIREAYLNFDQHDLTNLAFVPESLKDIDEITKPMPRNFINDKNFDFEDDCLKSLNNEEHGTAHVSIADQYGNVLSATFTVEWIFGNGMIVPGYGFLLNNEMTDFDPVPGACNSIESGRKKRRSALGLTSDGKQASKTSGGKRPRSSMTPLLVLSQGTPVASLGGAGGSTIIESVLEVFLNIFEHDMDIQTAVSEPRLYNNNAGFVSLEESFFKDKDMIDFLRKTKTDKSLSDEIVSLIPTDAVDSETKFKLFDYGTSVQGFTIDPSTGITVTGTDPRKQGLGLVEELETIN